MPRMTLKQLKALPPAPTSRLTFSTGLSEPDSYLEWMDIDRVGQAIRSARGGNTQPLFAIYRDIVLTHSHLQAEFTKRKVGVLSERFRVLPYDKRTPADVKAATFCESAIYGIPSWRMACSHLLDGCLWPVALVEKLYRPVARGAFALSELIPVPHHLLDFSSGVLSVFDTDPTGVSTGKSHPATPDRYIVHRGHVLSTPDNYGGPMRALVYWWLAATMDRDWWVRFLDRHGSPFIVGKFKPGSTSDRDVLLAAMSASRKLFGLAVSTTTTVDLIEASKAGADAFERFHETANREISKLVVGQTLSSQASATGELGGGTANLQAESKASLSAFDAVLLSDTLRDQLLAAVCSFGRQPGRVPYLTWGTLSQSELKSRADLLVSLRSAGLEPDDEGLEGISDDIGFGLRRSLAPSTSPLFSHSN